jgi:hypothetical protein
MCRLLFEIASLAPSVIVEDGDMIAGKYDPTLLSPIL